ncbi:MAG: DUF4240 domain-containing protein, partial [Planctomycetota bacterium]
RLPRFERRTTVAVVTHPALVVTARIIGGCRLAASEIASRQEMDVDHFWQIIDSVNAQSGGDMDRKCELLKEELSSLGPDDLRDFVDHFDFADATAYSWSLWGAAYVMHGGCSDDSFSDFRATLISRGRKVFEQALSDPESLAELDWDARDVCYEGFQYVKNEVAEDKLGEIPKRKVAFPSDPSGSEWDEDVVDQLYPKLAAKYSGDSDGRVEAPREKKPWWKFW